MYKNKLQELSQKQSLPFPTYQTSTQGPSHLPRFHSSVLVNGELYTSQNTFSTKKAAEQDAARCALDSLLNKTKTLTASHLTALDVIGQETVFCKSILYEFAARMQWGSPTYTTVKMKGSIPTFMSISVFNGDLCMGVTGSSKEEAEQSAARAAILSLLENLHYSEMLSEIIKSKVNLHALDKRKNTNDVVGATASMGIKTAGARTWILANTNNPMEAGALHSISGMNLPQHLVDNPVLFPHPSPGQCGADSHSSKKQRKC